MTILNRALTLLLVFGCAPGVFATTPEAWPIARGPLPIPTHFRYEPTQARQLPKPLLDASACLLYTSTTHLIAGDGTTETITHDLIRLNTRKAVEQLGEYRNIRFDPSYEKVTLHEARVHKSDGESISLQPTHAQIRDTQLEFAVYDPTKQVILSFPQLAVGDVIEIQWSTRGQNPEYPKQFFTRHRFGDDRFPTLHAEFRVRLPKDRSLRYASVNPRLVPGGMLDPNVTETADSRLYHWSAREIMGIPRESDLPSREEFRPEVVCSTFASWDDVGKWKRELRADCWECSADLQTVIRNVAGPLNSTKERTRALTYWIRRNIRYVSIGIGHDFKPHSPSRVFTDRFGDCKDATQLLAAMLRDLGIPSAVATVGTRGAGQIVESVPSPWGTHALIVITIDGQDHWIDPTASHARWDFLPVECRDRLAYVVDDTRTRILRTPPLAPTDHAIQQRSRISASHDGTAIVFRTSHHGGLAAIQRRAEFADEPARERQRQFSTELLESFPRGQLRSLVIEEENLADLDPPLAIDSKFEIPDHFRGEGERSGGFSDSSLWHPLLSVIINPERRTPVELPYPFESHHIFEITAPVGYRLIDPPSDYQTASPWGSYSMAVHGDSSMWRIEMRTRLHRTRIEPKEFDAFRRFREAIQRHSRLFATLVIATPAESGPDRLALEGILQLAPGDLESSRTLAELYRRAGQPADAERTVHRAVYYHPGERRLWEFLAEFATRPADRHAAFEQLLALRVGDPKYVLAHAELWFEEGAFPQARQAVQPLLRRSASVSAHAAAQLLIARTHLAEKQPRLALQHLAAAERTDPQITASADALRVLALARDQLGESAVARTIYEQLLRNHPDDRIALDALIRLHWLEGEAEPAMQYLRKLAQLAGEDPDQQAKLADWYLKFERFDDAFAAAQRSRGATHPGLTHRVLGLVYLRRGEDDQAVFHLDRCEPDAQVLAGLLQAMLRLGRLSEARLRLERAGPIERPPEPLRAMMLLLQRLTSRRDALAQASMATKREVFDRLVCAEWLYEIGESNSRIESLLGAEIENERIGAALALRSQRLVDRGRLRDARPLAVQAVERSPSDPFGYAVRARIAWESGQGEAAIADFRKAIALTPTPDPRWLHLLAAALGEAGSHEEAIALQRRAVKARPEDREFREQLRRFEAKSP